MPKKWTPAKEAKLRELLKEKVALSVPDSSHDITFGRNLIEGHDGEKLIEEALLKAEIKRDYRAGETGNVYIEFESRGKPSGISTTKADYHIFLLSDESFKDEVFIGIATERLKRIADSIQWVTRGGDNNTSKGKLVKLARLIKGE